MQTVAIGMDVFFHASQALLLQPSQVLLLSVAALFAGALNAVAGGGSFLTLPALIFCGVPALAANATGTLALLPGYMASAWGFREDIRSPPTLSIRVVLVLSAVGGALGAGLLLMTSNATFTRIVPWLLLAATLLFAFGPLLLAATRGYVPGKSTAALGVLGVALYGGYFNGGLGVLLLALFGLLGQTDLNAMNGLKTLVSVVLTLIAVVLYMLGGVIAWPQALLMMIAASIGGYFGARLGRRIPAPWLRGAIVLVGLTMTVLFFLRG